MKKKITSLLEETENRLKDENTITKQETEAILTSIQFFQHERLIHLLITLFFALFMILFFLFGKVFGDMGLFIVGLLLLVLLAPYIYHYYRLENGVQKMYALYDELSKRLD